jgi:hypothetical protein
MSGVHTNGENNMSSADKEQEDRCFGDVDSLLNSEEPLRYGTFANQQTQFTSDVSLFLPVEQGNIIYKKNVFLSQITNVIDFETCIALTLPSLVR